MKITLGFMDIHALVLAVLAVADGFGGEITTVGGLLGALENNANCEVELDLTDDEEEDHA